MKNLTDNNESKGFNFFIKQSKNKEINIDWLEIFAEYKG